MRATYLRNYKNKMVTLVFHHGSVRGLLIDVTEDVTEISVQGSGNFVYDNLHIIGFGKG
jgi:hypothetical protein